MVKKMESFEDSMKRLENLVIKLESGELTLEESLKCYEEGIKVSKNIYSILDEAEGKVKILRGENEENFEEGSEGR